MDFGLEKYQAEPTVDFEFDIEGGPKITLKQATRANKKFWSIYLKRTANISGRGRRRSGDSNIDKFRQILLDLVPRYVATGWTGIVASDGTEVEFSPENCEAFLRQLEAHLPDQLDLMLAFCQDPFNYREVIDEDELGNAL